MIGRIVTLVVALACAPVALAQAPEAPVVEVEAVSPEGLLAPETATATGGIVMRWSCSQAELLGRDRVHVVNFTISQAPSFVVASLAPHSQSVVPADPRDCDDEELIHEAETQVVVVATGQAPAFVPFEVPISMVLRLEPGALADSADEWGPFEGLLTFTPDFLARSEVVPDAYMLNAAFPDTDTVFNLRIRNLANGPATASVVLTPTTAAPGLEFVQPAPVTLGAPGQPDSSADVPLVVRIPEAIYRSSGVYPFQAEVTLRSAERDSDADVQVVVFSLNTAEGGRMGGDAVAPAVVPIALALALAVGIFAATRRRST